MTLPGRTGSPPVNSFTASAKALPPLIAASILSAAGLVLNDDLLDLALIGRAEFRLARFIFVSDFPSVTVTSPVKSAGEEEHGGGAVFGRLITVGVILMIRDEGGIVGRGDVLHACGRDGQDLGGTLLHLIEMGGTGGVSGPFTPPNAAA